MSVESLTPLDQIHPDELSSYPEATTDGDTGVSSAEELGEELVARAEEVAQLSVDIARNQRPLNLRRMPEQHLRAGVIQYTRGESAAGISERAQGRAREHRARALGICAACPLRDDCSMEGSLIASLDHASARDAITAGLNENPAARCDELVA